MVHNFHEIAKNVNFLFKNFMVTICFYDYSHAAAATWRIHVVFLPTILTYGVRLVEIYKCEEKQIKRN